MKLILVALFILSLGCTKNEAPTDWKEWVNKVKARYQETFSSPSIVHYVYLDKDGDSAFIKETSEGLRWNKECADCAIKVVRESVNSLKVVNKEIDFNKNIEMKKETQVDKEGRIYLSAYSYDSNSQMRVFIHDLKQKDLAKKRSRNFFDYSKEFLSKGQFTWLADKELVQISRSDGTTKAMNKIAVVKLMNDMTSELSIYDYGSDDSSHLDESEVMLIYRDYSNGKKTYGAGRFLTLELGKKLKDMKDGDEVSLDFNYSYNPPCAVSTGFHCPLPQDLLKKEILAGEKYTAK